MAWKNIKQRSFADDLLVMHSAVEELDDVHDLINWERIENLLSNIHTKVQGEKAWPPLMMYKALLLQSWYGLGDPALEKQLARDLLFRRFVGLSLSECIPDHSTFWRFRNLLEELRLNEDLLEEINLQLGDKGLFIRSGEISIIDASVIKAKNNRPNKGKDGGNTQDKEAFADSAYKSKKHDELLKAKHITNRVLNRAYRNKPLTERQKRSNRLASGTRSIVERVFGVLKLHYAMGNARYLGLARNKARFGLMCVAHNIKRGMILHRQTCEA